MKPCFSVQAIFLIEKGSPKEKAVGDICSRFFTIDGEIADEKMDERTIGINLQDLKQKETAILVAGGERKIKAIHGALRGGYANHFITDQFTAKQLLEQNFINQFTNVLECDMMKPNTI